ncbi:MAG: serine hydrolase [Bacteroidetes bacterium]|nr:serine hydrolase [Bacteroidota bacterium]
MKTNPAMNSFNQKYISKKSIRFYILMFLILLLFIFKEGKSQTFDTAYARKLQTALNTLKANNNIVGISGAVYVPGQGVWTGTAGITEVGVNLTPDMVFAAGSITKNFVAATILQLVEADSLSLNDSIYKWLPRINNVDSTTTIRQLLNHTSGIYNFTDNPAYSNAINANFNRIWEPEESFQYILSPYFVHGAGWHYSNTNYLLLAIIIKKITGHTFGQEIHSRIYSPLQMTGSFIEITDTLTAPWVHNWVDLNGDGILDDASFISQNSFASSTVGAGGVISRPENLVKYIRNLYKPGVILSQSSINAMTTFTSASISGANGYGLGTMRYNVQGKICWGHAGNSFGHSSVVMCYPQDTVCMSLMMNIDINTGAVANSFMNTVLSNRPLAVQSISSEVPEKFELHQNYPNPFNPETNIKFDIASQGEVKLVVYNSLGKEVQNIFTGKLAAGSYSYKWNASGFPSGVYFYKLVTGNNSFIKKMMLVK